MDLLRDYLDQNSQEAFAELVQRRINLVHSVAWRYTGDPHEAQDITQAVFIILAQKAGSLRRRTDLTGWLYETTRLTSRQSLRTTARRRIREQKAFMQSDLNDPSAQSIWSQLAPHLEEAMNKLNQQDRALIALHFFENKSFAETSALLGIKEWAARKRVARATEKLRQFFARRGVLVPAVILTAAISANSVQAAPIGLAKTVSAVAVTKGATASASTSTLIKSALKVMAWTKAKTTIVIIAGLLLAAGTTTVAVKKITTPNSDESWRTVSLQPSQINALPPQVRILPTKFTRFSGSRLLRPGVGIDKFVGINVPVSAIVSLAYRSDDPLGLPWPKERMIFTAAEPGQRYDFVATLAQGSQAALRQELETKLGFAGHFEARTVAALVLTVKNPNAPNRIPSSASGYGAFSDTIEHGEHRFRCENQPLSVVAGNLERLLKTPVVDQTGQTQHFNIDLRWNDKGGQEALKQALLDQLGLQIDSANVPVEMLVIEKSM
jgi:uncharacterized protein (TIGR03435 family)